VCPAVMVWWVPRLTSEAEIGLAHGIFVRDFGGRARRLLRPPGPGHAQRRRAAARRARRCGPGRARRAPFDSRHIEIGRETSRWRLPIPVIVPIFDGRLSWRGAKKWAVQIVAGTWSIFVPIDNSRENATWYWSGLSVPAVTMWRCAIGLWRVRRNPKHCLVHQTARRIFAWPRTRDRIGKGRLPRANSVIRHVCQADFRVVECHDPFPRSFTGSSW